MSLSKAQFAQKFHWQRKGSIARCIGLLTHHLQHNPEMPKHIRQSIQAAVRHLRDTYILEAKNNEFIGAKTPRRWKP